MSNEAQLRREIDGYSSTVSFILALLHEYLFDKSTRSRRSDATHEHGLLQPGGVTPDVALILPSPSVGLIGEAKYDFSKETPGRDRIRDQLLKYDSVLDSWLTNKRADTGSTVLLVHYTRKGEVLDYFEEEVKQSRFLPKRNFSIVTAARVAQADTFINLERAFGTLEPASIASKMRPLAIKEEHILSGDFATIRFYDAKPPLPLLLQVIWDHAFPSFASESNFHETANGDRIVPKGKTRGRRAVPTIEITVDDVWRKLTDEFSLKRISSTLPGSPERAFVEKALGTLVRYKLGTKNSDTYSFSLKHLPSGTLEFMIKKQTSREDKAKSTGKRQLALF